MTQRQAVTRTSCKAAHQQSLLIKGLGLLGGMSILSGSVGLAQTAPTAEPGAVPSAQDLLTPEVQPEPVVAPQAPAPGPAAAPSPVALPQAPAPEAVAPMPEMSIPGDVEAISPNIAIPELIQSPQPSAGSNDPYIDTTDYSVGATLSPDQQSTVVLSERSTGCQVVLQPGQSVPSTLCQSGTTVASQGNKPGSVNVGPITLSPNGIRVNRQSVQNFYNVTARPSALMGNGNLRLMFPLSIPVAITSNFGWRIHPIFQTHRFHSGTDLGAPMGTPILAAFTGQVAIADFMQGYGLTVVLNHEGETGQTLYAHMSEIFVRPGDWIEQGEVIGRVGSTGNSTGPHLHFEVRQKTPEGWVALDPGAMLEMALADFSNRFQLAQSNPEALISMKDLSKASKVAGTAYKFIKGSKASPETAFLEGSEKPSIP